MENSERKRFTLKEVVILLAFIVAGVVGTLYFSEKEWKKENDILKQRNIELQQQLKQTERTRLVLGDSINRINRRNEVLIQLAKEKDDEIKRIRGKYNNHQPGELELEMERRANLFKAGH